MGNVPDHIDANRITCPNALIRAENVFAGLFVIETDVITQNVRIERITNVEFVGDDVTVRFASGGETTTSEGNVFVTLGTEIVIR